MNRYLAYLIALSCLFWSVGCSSSKEDSKEDGKENPGVTDPNNPDDGNPDGTYSCTCGCLCGEGCDCAAMGPCDEECTCYENGEGGGENQPYDGKINIPVDTVGLLDFDIYFDDSDESIYGSMTESVSSDDDDIVENTTFTTTIKITYSESSASVEKSGSNSSSVEVQTSGADVTVYSTASNVEYILTGSTDNGSFKVAQSSSKFKVTLAGVSIKNSSGAAINLQSGKRVYLVCEDGTKNSLSDGSSYSVPSEEDMKGCLFAEGQIIFSGKGSLTVTSNYRHAICSDDYVRFRAGCDVTVEAAAVDGVHANEYVMIGGGVIKVNSEGDAIQSELGYVTMSGGFLKVTTTGVSSHGVKAETDFTISGGAIQASVSGNASKGISCNRNLSATGGKLTLLTSGDYTYVDNEFSSPAGIKCDGNMSVGGAEIYAGSSGSGGKGINVNGILTINDGRIQVKTKGDAYSVGDDDTNPKGIKADGNITINGATIGVIACGNSGSEAIDSKSGIVINDGFIAALSHNDCVTATNSISLNGGYLYCESATDDAFDSKGSISISGGVVVAVGSTNPDCGFTSGGTFTINGGVLFGIGGDNTAPSSASSQRSILYNGTGEAGEYIHLDIANMGIMTYLIPRNYSQMSMLFSCPDIEATSSAIYKGGSILSGDNLYGFYLGCDYEEGELAKSFNITSTVTVVEE